MDNQGENPWPRLKPSTPVDVGVPNAETCGALRQAREGENLTTWNSVDELIKSAE